MTPCISQACTMTATFAEDVAAWSSAGWKAAEVWLTKLETHLHTASAADTQKLLADNGINLVAAAYQGGLLLSHGEARTAHYDHFRRRLDLCQAFSIPTMLIAPDFTRNVSPGDLEAAVAALAQAGQWAAGFNVRLGLEFRAGESFCTSLDTATKLVASCGEPNVGVALDVFHYFKGPSKFDDFDLLTAENLVHVQICDLAGVPRELATDADRVLPGDGDLPLQPLISRLRDMGYVGPVSLELLNPVLWQCKPAQVADLGLQAMNRLLGVAT